MLQFWKTDFRTEVLMKFEKGQDANKYNFGCEHTWRNRYVRRLLTWEES